MPIARIRSKLIYFAHVPKCAGTSVEKYLEDRFGTLAFQNEKFLSDPTLEVWTRSSPQHVPASHLEALFPPDFFDASFAVVRHPVDRIASVYLFQREVEGTVPAGMSFFDWLTEAQSISNQDPFAFDNHTRPSNAFIPSGASVFRLEDGWTPVLEYLDALSATQDGPREMPNVNVLAKRMVHENRTPPKLKLSTRDREKVQELFWQDFEQFGYDVDASTRY